MITKEVNDWLNKIKYSNYKPEDIIRELSNFSKYLSREDLIQIKKILKDTYHL